MSTNPWNGFTVEPGTDGPHIGLLQTDRKGFRLTSTLRYTGATGLKGIDPADEDELRSVDPKTLPTTDLASVPGPFRWWVNTYGTHTPAALIHDRFIGDPPPNVPGRPAGVTEQQIDRYFRFMLRELGVPYFRRWLMWAAVACRTRFKSGLRRFISMVAWIVLAVAGVTTFVVALWLRNWPLAVAAALAPVPVSVLWGRQAGAGLIISYVGVPCLLAPSIIAIPFLAVYAVLEAIGQQVAELRNGVRRRPPKSSSPRRISVVWRRFFTTRDHATNVIVNRGKLRRYQMRRSVIAVVGALLAGVGGGLSLSHGGQIDTGFMPALGWPTAVAVLIALIWIFVPLPEALRIVAFAIAALVFFGFGLDIGWEWRLGLGIAGLCVSWVVAQALRFGLGATNKFAHNFRLLMGPAFVLIVVVFTTSWSVAPAVAQANGIEVCAQEALRVRVDGDERVFTGDVDLDDRLTIDVHGDRHQLVVDATSGIQFGTVVVELVRTRPIPMIGGTDRVVWVGDIRAGSTDAQPIEIRKRLGDVTYSIESPAHSGPLHLLAGEGLYRATFTDAESGTQCFLDARIRVTAPPTGTVVGLAGLGSAVLGMALMGGLLASGDPMPKGWPNTRLLPDSRIRGRNEPDGSPDRSDVELELAQQKQNEPSADSDSNVWSLRFGLTVREKKHDVYEIEARELGLLELVEPGFDAVLSTGGRIDIPFTVTADPAKVGRSLFGLAVDVKVNDAVLTTTAVVLTTSGFEMRSQSDVIALIDAKRKTEIAIDDAGKATVSQDGAPTRRERAKVEEVTR